MALAAMLLAITSSPAQIAQPPPNPPSTQSDVLLDWHGIENNFYANAKPYVELSPTELKSAVPELGDLEPAPNQVPLPLLLHHTGERTGDLLRNMPNLIAHEELVTQSGPKGKPWRQEYEYLILSHPDKDMIVLEEYRTAAKGKATQGVEDPLSKGFASEWMRFCPSHQAESRFRYLGSQRIDGHQTFVIAFAQIPDRVHFPTQVEFGGRPIAVLDQGVAWVDQTDFRIVRIRTDLLAPRPDIYLQKMTAEVHFTELLLPKMDSSVWLPDEAVVTWNFRGQTGEQRHLYSGYRFYTVHAKIVP
jgi:hypothetical protein